MKIAVGFDHGGFPLKQTVLEAVRAAGHEPIDMGTDSVDSVDFPDFTEKVGRAIQNGEAERGIIVCGSGVGACIAANKMKGVYASICHDTYSARVHDDMNVLCLGGVVGGTCDCLDPGILRCEYQGNKAGGERLGEELRRC
jgi:ribose 5-phosphate isomerase B